MCGSPGPPEHVSMQESDETPNTVTMDTHFTGSGARVCVCVSVCVRESENKRVQVLVCDFRNTINCEKVWCVYIIYIY